MNKNIFFVYGGILLVAHQNYLEMHDAMQSRTKANVASIEAYMWPTMPHGNDVGGGTWPIIAPWASVGVSTAPSTSAAYLQG